MVGATSDKKTKNFVKNWQKKTQGNKKDNFVLFFFWPLFYKTHTHSILYSGNTLLAGLVMIVLCALLVPLYIGKAIFAL